MNDMFRWLIGHPEIVLTIENDDLHESSMRIEMRRRYSGYRTAMMIDLIELEHALYDMLDRHNDSINRARIMLVEDKDGNKL